MSSSWKGGIRCSCSRETGFHSSEGGIEADFCETVDGVQGVEGGLARASWEGRVGPSDGRGGEGNCDSLWRRLFGIADGWSSVVALSALLKTGSLSSSVPVRGEVRDEGIGWMNQRCALS